MKYFLSMLFVLAAPVLVSAQSVVRYADREIDLSPYVPGESILAYRSLAGVPLLFVRQRTGGAIRIRAVPLNNRAAPTPIDPARALDLFSTTDHAKQHAFPR